MNRIEKIITKILTPNGLATFDNDIPGEEEITGVFIFPKQIKELTEKLTEYHQKEKRKAVHNIKSIA